MIAVTVDESGTRRAVTKLVEGERLVSCTCCTTAECCMYPANQLGIGYTEDDLPDTIDVDGIILGVPTRIIASRNGSFYGPINQSIFNGTAFSTYVFVGTNDFDEIVWFENTTNGVGVGLGEPCLILGNFSEPSAIDDTFADTYEVNFLTDKTVTVTRESLCFWFGQQTIDGFVYEASLAYNDATYSWEAGFSTQDVGSSLNTKDGDQNTPVGSYPGDYAITVTEP
jgi:hypothetical protein